MSGIERATLVHAHSTEATDVGKRERVNGNVPFVGSSRRSVGSPTMEIS